MNIEHHVCCDFCPKVNTDCVRLQGLHCAQFACIDCLRAAVQMLEEAQEPKAPSIICWWCRELITDDDPGRTVGDDDQEHIRECEYAAHLKGEQTP